MEITIDHIKALRDKTGVSVMQCKKALQEAGGDEEKALVILRKISGEIASKKADRELGAGVISAYIHADSTVGTMVELSCETDFVAKNEDFKKIAYDIAMHATATNPEFLKKEDVAEEDQKKAKEVFAKEVAKMDKPDNIKEGIAQKKLEAYFNEKVLLEQAFIKRGDITIRGLVDEAIQKFGEKIEITRFSRFSISGK